MRTIDLSCIEIAEKVNAGELSAVEVARAFIEQSETESELNALTHLAKESALSAAANLDARRKAGVQLGRLAGGPIAVKDAICTEGLPTTAGSRILCADPSDLEGSAWRPPYSATAVERLLSEGAIVLSKTNMDEFAMGSSNETSAYGPVKNPVDRERVPGGSSGGSAASVKAGLAPAALGSDTGGSIRQPAAFCGVVGVKPSYGRVSRYGLIAFASSLDQIGPLTKDVRSSARLLSVMAGDDPRDSTTATEPVGDLEAATQLPFGKMRFGLPEEYFAEGLDPRIRERIDLLVEKLRSSGSEVKPVSLPHTHYGVATYYILATAEASTNLSRFDGVRFGLRCEDSGANLTNLYERTRAAGFGDEVKRRILLGTYVLSAGFYDAYYDKAQRVRTLIRRDFEAVFSEVDALLTPTSPTVAFKLGERTSDPLSMYMADVYTLPASLAGISAISVPIGTIAEGACELPVGLQILCPTFGEETMFRASAGVEQLATDF
jgi:aspartyl-tRNA(Asn)/glutamyl-tRNA(Gln) amidotransferase subunit A